MYIPRWVSLYSTITTIEQTATTTCEIEYYVGLDTILLKYVSTIRENIYPQGIRGAYQVKIRSPPGEKMFAYRSVPQGLITTAPSVSEKPDGNGTSTTGGSGVRCLGSREGNFDMSCDERVLIYMGTWESTWQSHFKLSQKHDFVEWIMRPTNTLDRAQAQDS